MKKIKLFCGLLGLFVNVPIWFYLMFKILESVHASDLMWFLFWIYVPVSVGISVITKMVESAE